MLVPRMLVGAIAGSVYGTALAYLSVFAAGAGHGSFFPLFMSSAPLAAVGYVFGENLAELSFDLTVAGAPVIWAMFGSLAASGREKWLKLARILAPLHYASGLTLIATSQVNELERLGRMLRTGPEFDILWVAAYLLGQVALWWRIGSRRQPEDATTR